MDSFKRREATKQELIDRINKITERLALENGDTQVGEPSEDNSYKEDAWRPKENRSSPQMPHNIPGIKCFLEI